jgi:hypothetical protein
MIKIIKQLYLLILVSLFLGCGSGGNSSSTDQPENNENTTIKLLGKAQLGVLSKATVKLYKLAGVERKLLATEFTTTGETIDEIGNFNLHVEKLEGNTFYLYQVEGGADYDVDDNGIIDDVATTNQGTFHLLVLGRHIKATKHANITAISEVIYQKVKDTLNLETKQLEIEIEKLTKEIIKKDINEDGFVGIEDLLKYNPIIDRDKLEVTYQNKISKIIDDILNNRELDLDVPIFKNINSLVELNENLTLVQRVEISDASNITVKLMGVDAIKLNYNQDTQELSFLEKNDFENPQDNNKDNIFELTIEATDSYFNHSKKELLIKIIDLNETIPQIPILKETKLSISENNTTGTFIGTVTILNKGTQKIEKFELTGEDFNAFTIDKEGKIFSKKSFNYEEKNIYNLTARARNSVGLSKEVQITITIKDIPDVKPSIQDVLLKVFENQPIGTILGKVKVSDQGDSNITSIYLTEKNHEDLKINLKKEIEVQIYLDYELQKKHTFEYIAVNKAGESNRANLTLEIKNIFEYIGSDYPLTEDGLQHALDNGDYSFVLDELLNNRENYSNMDNDNINTNIAGAYVAKSGYTVYDISGAINKGDSNSFNSFVHNITKNNNPVSTINHLTQADTYYTKIVKGVNCSNSAVLTETQKDACYNLGLVRLTSLTNSVKLLFGGDSNIVKKWANGVDANSSDDLNGNGVLDTSEASACAVVYANNPNDNCKNGTIYSYRGGVQFKTPSREYNLTMIEVDVGNTLNGYQSFYKLISSNLNNNSPILTYGACNKNFVVTSSPIDGVNYFPCPTRDENGNIMGIKKQIEGVANIQSLFPDGDKTKTTVEHYLTNITGSKSGTIGLDNLSTYLRTH